MALLIENTFTDDAKRHFVYNSTGTVQQLCSHTQDPSTQEET